MLLQLFVFNVYFIVQSKELNQQIWVLCSFFKHLSSIDSTVRQLFMLCVNMEENKFSKHYHNKINDGITACPCWFPSVTVVNDGITAE